MICLYARGDCGRTPPPTSQSGMTLRESTGDSVAVGSSGSQVRLSLCGSDCLAVAVLWWLWLWLSKSGWDCLTVIVTVWLWQSDCYWLTGSRDIRLPGEVGYGRDPVTHSSSRHRATAGSPWRDVWLCRHRGLSQGQLIWGNRLVHSAAVVWDWILLTDCSGANSNL